MEPAVAVALAVAFAAVLLEPGECKMYCNEVECLSQNV